MFKKPSVLLAARLCILATAMAGWANSSFALEKKDELRADAVRKITDQSQLAAIAVEDKSPLVREAAVKGLTDQSLLARIALEDKWKYGIVREAAVGKLTDQSLLARIALGDESYGKGLSPEVFPRLRTVAVERVADQAVLAQVALEGIPADTTKYGYIRMYASILRKTAVGRMTDQTLLAKVALEGKASDARTAAVQKLMDPTLLTRVMHEGNDADLRDLAKKMMVSALLRAATAGDTSTVQSLATRVPLDQRDANGRTLLMLASENGRLDVVRFLLDSGVDVNAENVIPEYVQMPNGARAYPGLTMTVSEIASRFPGSVIVPGRRETALSLTPADAPPEIKELLVKAGAK